MAMAAAFSGRHLSGPDPARRSLLPTLIALLVFWCAIRATPAF
jgi:hypothetical protein